MTNQEALKNALFQPLEVGYHRIGALYLREDSPTDKVAVLLLTLDEVINLIPEFDPQDDRFPDWISSSDWGFTHVQPLSAVKDQERLKETFAEGLDGKTHMLTFLIDCYPEEGEKFLAYMDELAKKDSNIFSQVMLICDPI